jgi:3-hydroxyacyl-[acyl-carrier-protein] dehydratase
MRWNLVDRFEILKKGECSKAVKKFTGKEDFFQSHYPANPSVPEPLFIEMIAQTGGVLYGLGIDFRKEVILAKISNAEFKRKISPPCDFTIEAKIDDEREEGAWVSGVVKIKEEVIASAQMLLVTLDTLGDNFGKKIVFSDSFLKEYDVYRIAEKSQRCS